MMDGHGDSKSRSSQLMAFFAERDVKLQCPCCGKDGWMLIQNSGMDVVVPMMPNSGINALTNAIITDTLVCHNCGFIRMHARKIVDGESP
jgi:predicted RNA-binding Zn-ribbon protein involved in translation (DUF1610 family)